MYDIAIIGAGPAGLSAAITAASEGLSVVIVDEREYGGQCAESSLIENYPGFPLGITGKDLAANMVAQAAKFLVDFKCPFEIMYIERMDNGFRVGDGDEEIESRFIIVATGVQYRRLQAQGVDRYIGTGISYGSPSLSSLYENSNILVIGGANSAGQAAFHLSRMKSCDVKLIVRGEAIEKEMSNYLVSKIRDSTNIDILCNTNIKRVYGDEKLKFAEIDTDGLVRSLPVDRIFILIGGVAKVQWLRSLVDLDEHGFIITGKDGMLSHQAAEGIFVAGDVRASSLKRVPVAVAEGAIAVHNIHEYLLKHINEKEELIV